MTFYSIGEGVPARVVFGGLLALASLPLHGCVLVGLEPDEIDIADESGDGADDSGGGSAEASGADSMNTGDGDPDTGDGDPDTDTDPDTDPDTGDGDGDTDGNTGDGDPNGTEEGGTGPAATPCDELLPEALDFGETMVVIADGGSELEASCGAAGPEQIFAFSVDVDTSVSFSLVNADFSGALYLVDTICDPLDEVACAPVPGGPLVADLAAGVSYYLVVDTDSGGNATVLVE